MPKTALFLALIVAGAGPATGASLRLGFARRSITPALGERPVYLAGFGHGRAATGVHDDLYARAVAVSDGTRTVALVAVDLIGLSLEDTEKARELLRAQAARPAELLLASTHNHQGPDTIGLWGPSPMQSGVDPRYLDRVRGEVASVAREAIDSLREARLMIAKTKTPGLIKDTRLPEVIDDELVVLQAVGTDGKTLGTVVDWSSHPEALGGRNTLLTADYPHFLVARMEERLGGVAVFFSGSIGGLMTPLGVELLDAAGAPIPKESFAHAQAVGARAADAALEALARSGRASASSALEYRRRTAWVPLGNPHFRLAYGLGLFHRPLYTRGEPDERTGAFLFQGRRITLPLGEDLKTEVDYLRVGDVEILGVPGEIYPELVLGGIQDPQDAGADFLGAAKEAPLYSLLSAEFKMVIGLANDEIGYIIPRSEWDERPPFAYGRKEAQYGEINSVGDGVAPALIEAFTALLKPRP